MGEKIQIARSYIAQGLIRDDVLKVCGISKHQYYYQPKSGRRGRKPTSETLRIDPEGRAGQVPDHKVVEEIKEVSQDPDKAYGYRKMSYHLAHKGYLINHKKVYRLMKEAQLLKEKSKPKDKNYVRYRIIAPERPLQVLEMDIKMIWVAADRRHAYILTIIDTFTRVVLYWVMGYRMRAGQVKQAWEHVITGHLQPADLLSEGLHIELRNDNGPQFSATLIRAFLQQNNIEQVFTHPYTPQENGHIESFHSILGRSTANQVFWSFAELEERLTLFYEKYNNERLHSSLAYLWPQKFRELWDEGKIERIELSSKKVKFRLLISRHNISGNMSLREAPCSNPNPLNGDENLHNDKKCTGPKHFGQHRYKNRPQSPPADTKVYEEHGIIQ